MNLGSQDFDSNKGLEESSPDTGNPYQSNMEGLLSTHIEVVDTLALDPTEIRGSLGKKQEKWKRRARSEIVGNTLVKETQIILKRVGEASYINPANKRRESSLSSIRTTLNTQSAELDQ